MSEFDAVLDAFPRLSALVVGDICLDRWCHYEPRLADPSRETGIPRIAVTEVECTPGAAGTVAGNLASLGVGRVAVLGVAGEDGHGFELREALRRRGIEQHLVSAPEMLTFTYTKVINNQTGVEDLPRVDYIRSRNLTEETERGLIARFRETAPRFDVIVVSDQTEIDVGGAVTAAFRDAISEFAASRPDKTVWVDSRARGEHFRGVCLKLNEQEADEACARAKTDPAGLRRLTCAPVLMVTHGAEGADVLTDGAAVRVPARAVAKPVDICGAGDSFNAGAALVLRLTGDAVAAARFGNAVASVTIMKPGTGTAAPDDIRASHR